MKETIDYARSLVGLRRIEGQIRGIQRMIEEDKCTFDILTQIRAVKGALAKIEETILAIYLQHFIIVEVAKQTPKKKQKTIDVIPKLIHQVCKG